MDKQSLEILIKRYEDVYLFATKSISALISEQVLEELSLEQFAVLRNLHLKGTLKSSELAEYCGVNKSAMTAKIDRLEARQLVERIRDEEDRRNVYINITDEGRKIYLKGEEKIENFVASYLQELTHEELDSFITIYEKINTIIEKRRGGLT
ncbi:MarR family transcriptional regulator [Bacillus canaveralius]|uniref:MarR family transcriptional regulator n=1 Tax=Bacillus canaveralius TaxID=1403243 RepID=A0A2N5GJJ1_9BACI|nr:MarR family transcriptional regulator [Bacillus canaveralius]PLR81406.1 MarR family transcriptional regulator [Bacillus canaveralius]PLR90055.1 MarR family transcriptional regulator [Bacillus canaveralius]RSK53068.1 MarR family transcriptional regulator [Bacillus canaveralius]